MSDDVINGIVALLTAVIGVAVLSVLVGRNSNTASVLQAGGNAFANILNAATGAGGGGGLGGGLGNFGGLGGL